jgi:hypothetical protein
MVNRIAMMSALVAVASIARAEAPARLTVDADPPGTVVELARSTKKSCTTPCALDAPPGRVQLLLRGSDVEPSSVDVDVPGSGASIRVRAPSRYHFNVGALLTALGAPTALAGMGVAVVPATQPPQAAGATPYYGAGAAAIGIGVALTTAGAILLARERPRVVEVRR